MKKRNYLRTYSSTRDHMQATARAHNHINQMNSKGWEVVQFEISTSMENIGNRLVEVHFVTVLYSGVQSANENEALVIPEEIDVKD